MAEAANILTPVPLAPEIRACLEKPFLPVIQDVRRLPPPDQMPSSAPPIIRSVILLGWGGLAILGILAFNARHENAKAGGECAFLRQQVGSFRSSLDKVSNAATQASEAHSFMRRQEDLLVSLPSSARMMQRVLAAMPPEGKLLSMEISQNPDHAEDLQAGEWAAIYEFYNESDAGTSPATVRQAVEKHLSDDGLVVRVATLRYPPDSKRFQVNVRLLDPTAPKAPMFIPSPVIEPRERRADGAKAQGGKSS